MMLSYKSDFPNQVHQLNISISQNHYLLKNNEIKYQEKKFEINWKNFEKTGKNHLVNFLIRDHFSNCFYAEIHPINEIPNVKDFLFNAWRQKENFEFCGIPKTLILAKNIITENPKLLTFAKNIGDLNIQLAENGFATGIRSVRDWENNIKYFTFFEDFKNYKDFKNNFEFFCRKINLRESGKTEVNLKKWMENNPRGLLIENKKEFDNLFEAK